MSCPVEVDPDTGARYFRLADRPVARCVFLDDLVVVDLDEHGKEVGVELAYPGSDDVESDEMFDIWQRLAVARVTGNLR